MKTLSNSGIVPDIRKLAAEVLFTADPDAKCHLVYALHAHCLNSEIETGTTGSSLSLNPGRPPRPELLRPNKLPKRSLFTPEGRVVFMHAIAHIEFNAINLACDAICRFDGMPEDYYRDWLSVADDEARHYQMIVGYLRQHGQTYGDYAAHDGLWDMAVRTAHDVLARMALVPRVLEARGLDVTPAMIEKLREAGDGPAAAILEVIYQEEIRHVEIGSRWFHYVCAQRGLEPEQMFFELVSKHLAGQLRGPFNIDARKQAGFSTSELKRLMRSAD